MGTTLQDELAALVKRRNDMHSEIQVLRGQLESARKRVKEVESEVRSHFGDRVFRSVIPRNVRLSEAPSHGKPVLLYDIHSKGAVAYLHLAEEILKRIQRATPGFGSQTAQNHRSPVAGPGQPGSQGPTELATPEEKNGK